MSWLHYLLEANLYLAVFYAGYYLFLSRETYYTLNRFYLLFGSVVSFILPVMQLGILKPVEQPITAVRFAFTTQATTFIPVHTAPVAPIFTWQDGIVYAYLLGAVVLLVVLLIKFYQLLKLTRVKKLGSDGGYKVVHINESDTAFSFFNYLFIGTNVEQAEMIIKHELVHIRQKHSADIIFIELLKIINWFNPFIYLLQYSLREIHEYIADEKIASSGTDALTYSSFLVNNAYGLSGSSITHSFFNYNLLKKRIIMLHQKRSGSLARLKYLLAIPICGGLLCASTLAFSKTYELVDLFPKKADANHIELPPPQPAPPAPSVNAKKLSLAPIHNSNTSVTSKKVRVEEFQYMVGNKIDFSVAIYRKNFVVTTYFKSQASDATIKFLSEKYGYTFPANGKYELAHPGYKTPLPESAVRSVLPRAIPSDPNDVSVPSPTIKMIRFPPPVVVPDGKTPPPPPPAPPVKSVKFPLPKTSKGYPFSEYGYTENGKSDIVVTIQEKDGSHKEYDKNKATTADLALLKEKYGYAFPAHLHVPPPPPPVVVPDAKTPPPPPPAPPKSAKLHRLPPPVVVPDHKGPPPPPAQIIINDPDTTKAKSKDKVITNGLYMASQKPANTHSPLIFVNGARYNLTADLKPGQYISWTASDSTISIKSNNVVAMKKWGPEAANGVILLYGKVSVSVK